MKPLPMTAVALSFIGQFAMGLDPFYTDEQTKAMVESYKRRDSLAATRQTHGIPFALAIEQVRIPSLKLDGASVVEAVTLLRDQLVEKDPTLADVKWLLDLQAASGKPSITLDLKDLPFMEALRYVTSHGGVGYCIRGRAITLGSDREPWMAARTKNFLLSEPLIDLWLPGKKSPLSSPPLVPVEKLLDGLGIPFGEGAQADFVPSMNALCVVNGEIAHRCLEVLIEETEAELIIKAARADSKLVPDGMEMARIDVSNIAHPSLKWVLRHKDRLIAPESSTTQYALRSRGAIFPAGAAAWLDQKKRMLYVINRPELLAAIRSMLDD